MPVTAAIALGSNIGDRQAHISYAFKALETLQRSILLACGPVIQTLPVAHPSVDPGGLYLNSAALLETDLSPRELLDGLHAIEQARGRNRAGEARWSARTLDLDLLTYGDRVIDQPGLIVPHSRMASRRFVLEPLHAIAPDLLVPGLGRVHELLERLGSSQ